MDDTLLQIGITGQPLLYCNVRELVDQVEISSNLEARKLQVQAFNQVCSYMNMRNIVGSKFTQKCRISLTR